MYQMTPPLFPFSLVAQAQPPFKLEICHHSGGVGWRWGTTVLTKTLG